MNNNPWIAFANAHKRNEHITAPVSRIRDFGIFVQLEGGIEGIIHVGDLSWTEPGDEVIKRFSVGDMIETIILKIEPERERICLSIKHLFQRPDPDKGGRPTGPSPMKPTSPKPPNKPMNGALQVGKSIRR